MLKQYLIRIMIFYIPCFLLCNLFFCYLYLICYKMHLHFSLSYFVWLPLWLPFQNKCWELHQYTFYIMRKMGCTTSVRRRLCTDRSESGEWTLGSWTLRRRSDKKKAPGLQPEAFSCLTTAEDGTWTHTILLPQAPEACASANSATSACVLSYE